MLFSPFIALWNFIYNFLFGSAPQPQVSRLQSNDFQKSPCFFRISKPRNHILLHRYPANSKRILGIGHNLEQVFFFFFFFTANTTSATYIHTTKCTFFIRRGETENVSFSPLCDFAFSCSFRGLVLRQTEKSFQALACLRWNISISGNGDACAVIDTFALIDVQVVWSAESARREHVPVECRRRR